MFRTKKEIVAGLNDYADDELIFLPNYWKESELHRSFTPEQVRAIDKHGWEELQAEIEIGLEELSKTDSFGGL